MYVWAYINGELSEENMSVGTEKVGFIKLMELSVGSIKMYAEAKNGVLATCINQGTLGTEFSLHFTRTSQATLLMEMAVEKGRGML